jgi:putative aminopeptidase FrvX
MISAHLDEIGFIVKGVEPTGFLRFSYSANKVIDLNDAARAVRLLARFVTEMEQHVDLGFL